MNLFIPVACATIAILGGGCLVYKSYNPIETSIAPKKSRSRTSNPLEIKPESKSITLKVQKPVAVS